MRPSDRQMGEYLSRHDMIWDAPPAAWNTGIPLANGHIGALIWGDGSPLKITLDKYDCWELREQVPDPEVFNYAHLRELVAAGDEEQCRWDLNDAWRLPEKPHPTRLPMPRVEIDLPAGDGFSARLRLHEVHGVPWTARVDAHQNLLRVDFADADGVAEPRVSLDHLDDEAKQTLADWGYEPPQTANEADGCRWLRLRAVGTARGWRSRCSVTTTPTIPWRPRWSWCVARPRARITCGLSIRRGGSTGGGPAG